MRCTTSLWTTRRESGVPGNHHFQTRDFLLSRQGAWRNSGPHATTAGQMIILKPCPVSPSEMEPLPRFLQMRRELKFVRNESGMGRQAHTASAQLGNLAIRANCGAMWSPNQPSQSLVPIMLLLGTPYTSPNRALSHYPVNAFQHLASVQRNGKWGRVRISHGLCYLWTISLPTIQKRRL